MLPNTHLNWNINPLFIIWKQCLSIEQAPGRGKDRPIWVQHTKIINHLKLHGEEYIDGLMQNCSIPSALAMGILQYCTKPSNDD